MIPARNPSTASASPSAAGQATVRPPRQTRQPITTLTTPAEVSDIVIYGQPDGNSIMRLRVSRLLPHPPARPPMLRASSSEQRIRLPRPDDPTPRKVPLTYFGERPSDDDDNDLPGPSKRRRTQPPAALPAQKQKGKEKDKAEETLRRAREVMIGADFKRASSSASVLTVPNGKAARKAKAKASDALFKVPSLPLTRTASAPPATCSSLKGKEKAAPAASEEDVFGAVTAGVGAGDVEAANKVLLKRLTVAALKGVFSPDARAVAEGKDGPRSVKEHPAFKELFNHVYRGVSFAMVRVRIVLAQLPRLSFVSHSEIA
jgi:hypothetical protein